MTLEELAKYHAIEHTDYLNSPTEFLFDAKGLRALITEAVGIVQGDVVAYAHKKNSNCVYSTDEMDCYPPNEKQLFNQLHHNDMARLK